MNENTDIKIKRTFVKDEAYNILHDKIISGTLKPYTQLKITELSKELGISRTPVREAILRLENEGLVITKANQWTMVAPIKVESLKDIYEIVLELETYILKNNFSKIDDDFINELIAINENIKKEHMDSNILNVINLDNDFHDKIIELSPNKEIKPIIDKLKKRLKRFEICFYKAKDTHKEPSTYNEHLVMIEAFQNRDLEKSLEALKKNWTTTITQESIEKINKIINQENSL
ncbi:GntR family transcriptional regulator [uncultured Anaerococcus sp.]|uniref:GntR family transcriptional regulator n=1 Tax=uncultured Anaerococcus sp. TaxID=293428 RepID=UPI00261F980A|nr:GntR family transcriptional regulator [uncultured Anaerococcus sp.]